ncbi:T9SS type B sorting domain-containing protein [Flavobacterium sp. F372]|uniref:T9SS type B sorting domain-containing protein n=1 Tax=Flavobacterium bernardetii TaxID=2813823 RepID=A0ABR7IV68_9FLAO|nr:choice-of-anchor L domain-containing protein [Flavobacterium bernardetii]MBC5833387.1 T9SS type B sorting domain-containing protein [Flavobacterium bernardetii]NHF68619.1 T9SS type B sorting domain-containing protein [Flavobacterium bernardetii]
MKKILFILFSFSFTVSFSQNITVNETFTPQQLIENILVNSGCVSVSNFSTSGGNFGTGELSYGYFNANGSSFPFQDGIILSTGKLNSAVGPNSNFSDDGNGIGWTGDSDLNTALGLSNTFNATALEFDFVPNANNISFEYIFSSEQYLLNPQPNQCNFTDGFAFLLKEATATTYQNLALIPGTSTPVRVNTVRGNGTICPSANDAYFDAFNTGSYPTSYDGQTKVLTAQSVVTPGTLYHIKLVIADEGNGRFDSGIFLRAGSFISEKDLGADRLIATGNPLCNGQNLTLNATQTGATNYQWFQNGNPVGTNSPTYNVTSAGTYDVQIDINTSCTLTGSIEIEYAPNLVVLKDNFKVCDTNSDGLAPFDLATIQTQIFSNLPANFTVALFDSPISTTPLPSSYSNTTPFQQIIYARIINIQNCYGNTPITLNVNVFSETFSNETIGICNNTPTNISAPSGFFSYSWNTNPIQTSQSITVSNSGTYIVTITNAVGCSKTKTFTVVTSEVATITNIDVTDFNEELIATISVSGNGNYEYSLDGITFQNSPIFNLLDAGEYTIYVNDKNNCGVVFETFYALSYPKFFTPNGDNYNDTWQIKNLDKKGLENNKLTIFDRFGKLLKQIKVSETGWNGTFNGNQLSSSDYWFVLELTNGKTIKGHFSLKR